MNRPAFHQQGVPDLEGLSYRQIQKKMQFSFEAVQTAIYNYEDTGNFKDKERCGRPRITTPKREELFIASVQAIED